MPTAEKEVESENGNDDYKNAIILSNKSCLNDESKEKEMID